MEKSIKPDKKYFTKIIWMFMSITVLILLIVGIIHLIINLNQGEQEAILVIWFVGLGGLFLMWLIATPIAFLWIKNLEYTIHGDGIRIHKGIITKTKQNIPYRAVTDFALERSLYDRILGIGAIKIQTAGQSHSPTGYEGKLAGLTAYDEWHEDLRDRVKALHPVSESVATAEKFGKSDTEILNAILKELQEINKKTTKDQA